MEGLSKEEEEEEEMRDTEDSSSATCKPEERVFRWWRVFCSDAFRHFFFFKFRSSAEGMIQTSDKSYYNRLNVRWSEALRGLTFQPQSVRLEARTLPGEWLCAPPHALVLLTRERTAVSYDSICADAMIGGRRENVKCTNTKPPAILAYTAHCKGEQIAESVKF